MCPHIDLASFPGQLTLHSVSANWPGNKGLILTPNHMLEGDLDMSLLGEVWDESVDSLNCCSGLAVL